MSIKKHIFISYPIILVTVILDQVTKFLAANKSFSLINGVVSVYDSPNLNTGGAWSIFSGKVEMLTIISIFFLIFLIFITHKFKEKTPLYSVSYAFIIGGAIGNLIDRIFLKGVRDFIRFDFMNFPIFNLADSFLVLGIIMFFFFVIFYKVPEGDKKK